MSRVPHLHLPGPWGDAEIPVPSPTLAHLERVLRLDHGSAVSYTDGGGTRGEGVWRGEVVERGAEAASERTRLLTVAVAPPKSRDRQRFLVEKLQELGVARLLWLTTQRTVGHAPRDDRARGWAVSALEQSRGVHLMEIASGGLTDVTEGIVLDPHAPSPLGWPGTDSAATVVVGPEGGFAPDEVAAFPVASMGSSVLRTETAAIVAAAVLLIDPSR